MKKIFNLPNPLKILQKSRQQRADKRKIAEQEELIRVLKRPENEPRRRPAMKYSNNLGPK